MRIWSVDEIAERLIARLVVRSGLSDLRETDPAVQACRGFAIEIVDAVNTLWANRDDNYFGTAADSALDEILADILPDGANRSTGARAVGGQVTFSRSAGSTGVVVVSAGTPVSRKNDGFTYRTIAEASFGFAATVSDPPVSVVAAAIGAKGNCEAGDINRLGTSILGVTGCTNAAAIDNGSGAATDEEARQDARAHVKGISPAVPDGILRRVKALEDPTYGKVRHAKWMPVDGSRPGYRELVIDDGMATAGPVTTIATGEVMLGASTTFETLLYLRNRPLVSDPVLYADGVEITDSVYWTRPWGQVALSTAVAAGERVTAGEYKVYGGLVAAAQRLIDGDPSNLEAYPGIGGLGDVIRVRPSRLHDGLYTSVTFDLEVASNFAAISAALAKILAAYINGLGIGETLYLSEIVRIVKSYPGVRNVSNVKISGSASDRKPATDAVLRTREANIVAS